MTSASARSSQRARPVRVCRQHQCPLKTRRVLDAAPAVDSQARDDDPSPARPLSSTREPRHLRPEPRRLHARRTSPVSTNRRTPATAAPSHCTTAAGPAHNAAGFGSSSWAAMNDRMLTTRASRFDTVGEFGQTLVDRPGAWARPGNRPSTRVITLLRALKPEHAEHMSYDTNESE